MSTDGFRLGERVEHVSHPGVVGRVGPIAVWDGSMWPRFQPPPRPDAVPVHWPGVDRWERPEYLRRVT